MYLHCERSDYKNAEYFGILFDEVTAYQELKYGTPKLVPYIELISVLHDPNSFLVPLEGIEPPSTVPKTVTLSVKL